MVLRTGHLFAPLAFVLLAACGSQADDPAGPAPADPLVYGASDGTKQAVGVAKWGYAIDDGNGELVFRAYGAKNDLVAEIRQSVTLDADGTTKHYAMTLTGVATAAEHIDFVAQWSADGSEIDYTHVVVDNTFLPGSVAAKMIERLGADATLIPHPADGSTGGLVGNSHPLDDSPTLTPGQSSSLLVCTCADTTDDSAAQSALAAQSCSLVSSMSDPLEGQDEDVAGDLHPDELVLGADGKPVVKSPWAGPYNIVDHHCHNAAAQNSSKTDGYIACVPSSSSTTTQGHTINWAPDPSAGGKAGAFCAYEPQSNGGTLLTNSVCCWQGNAAKDGSPTFDTAGAKNCATKMCLGQAYTGGSSPQAFPAGSTPPTPNDCPGSTGTLVSCNSCCTTQATNVSNLFVDKTPQGKQFAQQVADYKKRCATGCTDRDTIRQQQQAAQNKANQSSLMCRVRALASSYLGSSAVSMCKVPSK
ncbi:MAG TPA: hypothetical protein VIF62_01235 [Labilithrix sp.]